MKTAALLLLILLPQHGLSASAQTVDSLLALERTGLRYHQNGDYGAAFTPLDKAARGGMKQSQYVLAFMHLKGQYVEQSLIEGMAWLGVAKESGEKDWQAIYTQVYKAATKVQQKEIKTRVAEYTKLYGLKAQNISCKKRRRTGTSRVAIECIKRSEVREDMYDYPDPSISRVMQPRTWPPVF